MEGTGWGRGREGREGTGREAREGDGEDGRGRGREGTVHPPPNVH